jgi:3-oxoacyl-[acyl-carrier-protein] synthase-3
MPPGVVDNPMLSRLVQGYDAERSGDFGTWVDQMTHIHERRFTPRGTRSSDLARIASERALASAGIEARDVGLVIYATFTPSEMIPGDHCLLAETLGCTNAGVMMLMAACAGSIYGLGVAYGMIASGVHEHVLVVGTETASKALNFHDPITSILFGDGAGAAVVSRGDAGGSDGLLPPHLAFEYSARNIHLANSNIPVDVAAYPDKQVQPGVRLVEQALVEMEGGPSVLRMAVKRMAACAVKALGYEEKEIKAETPGLMDTLARARVVPHQANGRILDGMAKELKLAPERVLRTIYRYGNISAASNLVALDHGLRTGNMERRLDADGRVLAVEDRADQRIEGGDLVLLPSIGGGYLMGCVGFVAGSQLAAQTPHDDPAAPLDATALATLS